MDRLSGKSDKCLAAIGVMLGFHIVEPGGLSFSGGVSHVAFSLVAAAGLGLLFGSLAMVLWSMRLRPYPTFSKTAELEKLAEAVSEDSAKYSAAEFYLVLRDEILELNEKRASAIKVAGVILAAGFLMTALGQLGLGLKL